ncbi:sigma 54-interacting transcriptional regulator [Geomonas sp.]|uniref:sigma 54-interacting transcriptional regulator n=1 Tax=Geomonas sp. TaxID=2651584 RepID=UPI002B487A71|nr:sigma 54-interacting transcriptional regulator [Geomonas sp.]HJV35735.1 sigma 54-interacting transcriptional regulator [Geomonas sp.]
MVSRKHIGYAMSCRVWHNFHLRGTNSWQSTVCAALSAAGVTTYPLSDSGRGPGLLFFDEVTPALCQCTQELSESGRERVLAVALGQQPTNSGIWSLMEAGASDVLTWDDSTRFTQDLALRLERWQTVNRVLESSLVTRNLVGQSPAWRDVLRQVVEVAHVTDAPIYLTGESGTGKELMARLIHSLDCRPRKRDLVVLDCTTVVPSLAGSEFFGHEKGAFTGAFQAREGAFAMADGGTLFLDEVGELPLELQAQLLRVVQEKIYKRVGGNSWLKTEFRLVSATNRSLVEEVGCGKFRSDLYYRIAGWSFRLPPLRERLEDILPLARHFMADLAPDGASPELDPPVAEFLLQRRYPGNVRDLRQLMVRIMARHVGSGPVTVGDIPDEERPRCGFTSFNWCDPHFEEAIRNALVFGVGLKEIGRSAEDTAVRIAVGAEAGNLQRAAKRLGVTDRALQLRRAGRQNGSGTMAESSPPSA